MCFKSDMLFALDGVPFVMLRENLLNTFSWISLLVIAFGIIAYLLNLKIFLWGVLQLNPLGNTVSLFSSRIFKALPLIIYWDIWITRNREIFQDHTSSPRIIAAKAMEVLSHYPQEKYAHRVWELVVENPDKSFSCAYFDGALMDLGGNSGGIFILYPSPDIYFHIYIILGVGSNNSIELLACQNLHAFAIKQGVSHIQLFLDSKLLINCMNDNQSCRNFHLYSILNEVLRLKICPYILHVNIYTGNWITVEMDSWKRLYF